MENELYAKSPRRMLYIKPKIDMKRRREKKREEKSIHELQAAASSNAKNKRRKSRKRSHERDRLLHKKSEREARR